jgi:glutathione-regulated potassium-efflux system ancillary protein KefG
MNKILILFAHPRFEKSRNNRVLLAEVDKIDGLTLHDLYEEYPDFNIDTEREKALLTAHDIIVWHFPFYMYSAPAMLKQWMDTVLEYGWAHGSKGDALAGKTAFVTLTAGGSRDVYAADGRNRYTIREFLFPFEQTAVLCKMAYLPPFVVHGTYLLTDQELAAQASLYSQLLTRMAAEGFDAPSVCRFEYLSDWLSAGQGQS